MPFKMTLKKIISLVTSALNLSGGSLCSGPCAGLPRLFQLKSPYRWQAKDRWRTQINEAFKNDCKVLRENIFTGLNSRRTMTGFQHCDLDLKFGPFVWLKLINSPENIVLENNQIGPNFAWLLLVSDNNILSTTWQKYFVICALILNLQ